MNEKQKRFADHYLVLNNGTKAAIAAGYSEKTARIKASQLLVLEDVELYIEERRKKISEVSLIDAAWVQNRFKDISDRCMTAVPVMIFDGTKMIESGEYKFDSSGANKATENLGKLIGAYVKDNEQKTVNVNLMSFDPLSDVEDNAGDNSTS